MSVLQIKNLSAIHKKDLKPIFKDLSFTLRDGDRCAVIGEEGNGKSTLLKLIAAPWAAEDYIEAEGKIITGGASIGYLPQELSEEEKSLAVYDYCSLADNFFDITPRELSDIARELSIPHDIFYENRKMETLSGGEKVKLELARAIIGRPDIFLLDEPSGDLDLDALQKLEKFILTCGKPVLYISHDETLLERTANMVIHLELVRRKTLPRATVLRSGYREYVNRRLNSIAHQEQVARDEKARFDEKQERLRKLKEKVNQDMTGLSPANPHTGKMLKRKMHAVTSMEKRFEKESETLTEIPDTEDAILISFGKADLPASKRILELNLPLLATPDGIILSENIHLTVTGGEKLCIVGKNGAGKSTLLKLIAGELLTRKDIRAEYMPQNYSELLPPDKTPVEFLSVTGDRKESAEIRTFLGSVKYTPEEMEHSIGELSGGQKAKLIFIRMIRSGANVLLLDEPTRNFSPMSNPVIRKILREFSGAVIAVSHDRKFIEETVDKIYTLDKNGLSETEKDALFK